MYDHDDVVQKIQNFGFTPTGDPDQDYILFRLIVIVKECSLRSTASPIPNAVLDEFVNYHAIDDVQENFRTDLLENADERKLAFVKYLLEKFHLLTSEEIPVTPNPVWKIVFGCNSQQEFSSKLSSHDKDVQIIVQKMKIPSTADQCQIATECAKALENNFKAFDNWAQAHRHLQESRNEELIIDAELEVLDC